MNVRRGYRAAVATVFAVAATVTFAQAPAAATTDTRAVVTDTRSITFTPAGDRAGIRNVITCNLTVHYPHKSSHVPNTVNVIAQVVCSAPVARLTNNVVLMRNGIVAASGPMSSNTGMPTLQASTITGCVDTGVDRQFMGSALAQLTSPPGYLPPFATMTSNSPTVGIRC